MKIENKYKNCNFLQKKISILLGNLEGLEMKKDTEIDMILLSNEVDGSLLHNV